MGELLRGLPKGAMVLDLGRQAGSFPAAGCPLLVVRADLERELLPPINSIQADSARLPFREKCFDAIVCNHSLEHFENLTDALSEIGRVIKPGGALYAAVPDATTITDRLYRWLARGGGHVNAFRSGPALASEIRRSTAMRHVGSRTLCTSLSFLNRRNCRSRLPRRAVLVGGGTQFSLALPTYFFRLLDRLVHTRTSVYGWALYFGSVELTAAKAVWKNVCIRRGSGHPSAWLKCCHLVRRFLCLRLYRCPICRTLNLFTDDEHYRHLADA